VLSSTRRWARNVRDAIRDHERDALRYELLEELGRGGMAVVWRARDRKLGRDVALKLLRDDVRVEEENLERFRREAEAAAALSHPNIVTLLDAGEEAGRRYLAMEWVRGEPLSRLLDSGRPEFRLVASLLERAARGVHHAHERGIVHRDLKPANVLVAADGTPKIADFGIAQLAGRGTAITQSGVLLGTPVYMAPEQAEGRAADVSPRTDVYALGAILYEALAGRPPHDGDTTMEILRAIAQDDPVPPRLLRPGVPAELEIIALKALDKEPARRYATAADFADDLDRWLHGRTIVARRPSFLSRLLRRVRRHRASVTLGALVVAVAAGALVMLATARNSWRAALDTREVVEAARRAARDWEYERYGVHHDIGPARRRLEQAVAILERAVAMQPDAHAAWAELGWSCLQLGRLPRATEALARAAQLDPSEGAYHFRVGRAALAVIEREKAALGRYESPADRDRARRAIDARWDDVQRAFERALASPRWIAGADWERDYAQTFLHHRAGRYAEAKEACARMVARHAFGAEEALLLLGGLTDDLRESIALFDAAVDRARSHPPAYLAAARARTLWGELRSDAGADLAEIDGIFEKSVAGATTALEVDPASPDAWFTRAESRGMWGVCRSELGQDASELYRAAEADVTKAIELDPARADSWLLRGKIRGDLGQRLALAGGDAEPLWRDAMDTDFREARRLEPSEALARTYTSITLFRRAMTRWRRGVDPQPDFKTAIDEADAAIALAPDSAMSWTARGRARVHWASYLTERGKDPGDLYRLGLEEDLAKALERDKNDATIEAAAAGGYALWAEHLGAHGEDPAALLEAAVDHAGRALTFNPRLSDAWYARAWPRCVLGLRKMREGVDPSDDYRAAIADLDEAARLRPSCNVLTMRAAARVNWGIFSFQRGHGEAEGLFRAGMDDARRACEMTPDDRRAWMSLGSALHGMGGVFRARGEREEAAAWFAKAVDALSKSIEIDPGNADAFWYRGLARYAGLKYVEAIADWSEALRLNPAMGPKILPWIEKARAKSQE
jgi:serine/threonine-protein kinase